MHPVILSMTEKGGKEGFSHLEGQNIIFHMHIILPRLHPVQSSSRSVYCITTDILWKHTKSAE